MFRAAKEVNMIRHDHVAAHDPTIQLFGVLPNFTADFVELVVC
jgi:hypothetical protein